MRVPAALRAAAAATAAATALAACGGDPGPERSTWRGAVAPGQWVRIKNVNGPVRVARAAGAEVVIVATRTHRGPRPEPLRMLVTRDGGHATACAVWAGADRCGERPRVRGLLAKLLHRTGSTQLAFTVALPAGVRLEAATVNGHVTVADAAGDVVANTVNGSVTVGASGGPVRARTVNGSVSARLDALAPDAAVSLETVNGSVTALVPPRLDASLEAATTNGRITTDLPGVAVARGGRTLQTVLGAGGRAVSLRTVNGGVRISRLE